VCFTFRVTWKGDIKSLQVNGVYMSTVSMVTRQKWSPGDGAHLEMLFTLMYIVSHLQSFTFRLLLLICENWNRNYKTCFKWFCKWHFFHLKLLQFQTFCKDTCFLLNCSWVEIVDSLNEAQCCKSMTPAAFYLTGSCNYCNTYAW